MFTSKQIRLMTVSVIILFAIATWSLPGLSQSSPAQELETHEPDISSSTSPLTVRASISPAPIVGQEVTWHIEMSSLGPELPNTTLYLTIPNGVELTQGDP